MGTEAADSIGQGSAGIGSSTSTSTDVAADMVSEHRTAGTLDTTALAADVRAHTPDDPRAQADHFVGQIRTPFGAPERM